MQSRFLIYAIVIALSVAAIAGVVHLGERWHPAAGIAAVNAAGAEAHGATTNPLARPLALLIIQLLVIVLATQLAGALATRLRQPAVVGEIAAGLMLGPSLLGQAWPAAAAFLFPDSSLGVLQLLSQLGIILFMFSVGLDVDFGHLKERAPTAVAVSHFSIVVPFLLGVVAALPLYSRYAPAGIPFHSFALFMGIALSITAFPVLARVIEERGLTKTPLGTTALACAAVDDVTAWSLLALVVTLATAGGKGGTLAIMVAALAVFTVVMVWVVRPGIDRLLHPSTAASREYSTPLTRWRMAQVLLLLFSAALVTEVIGIHALFGAFLAGTIMPADGELRTQLRERFEALSTVFLLPIFFAYTGLRTEIGLLNDVTSWAVCLAIILTAIAGKLMGSTLAARWSGSTWHDAFVLGALMNTRGLMELVALNVGYDLGILSPHMFTMLVVMALVTTVMTGPLLDLASSPDARRAGRIARR
jgi:Kef-type K+ transport system membrane component KefB